jgi:hypothetical protein
MQVALVTCTNPPQEDFDAPPLLAALRASGHRGAEVAWDDPELGIDWPAADPVLSDRDRSNPSLSEALRNPVPYVPHLG